jgi:hypothetical protein
MGWARGFVGRREVKAIRAVSELNLGCLGKPSQQE